MISFFSRLLSGNQATQQKAEVYRLRRVCCVCKAEMGTKPCEQALHGLISHGYCPTCTAAQLADLEKFNQKAA